MSLTPHTIDRLKRVCKRDKYLVNGYVRLMSELSIPSEIISICLAHLIIVDEWDKSSKGKYLQISGENNENVECTGHSYQSILGKLKVSSGKHHWKFRITKMNKEKEAWWRIVVGIIPINKFTQQQLDEIFDDLLTKYKNIYGVLVNYKDRESSKLNPFTTNCMGAYGNCCNEVGDEIDMYLDLDIHKLSFGMKGKNYGDVYQKDVGIGGKEFKMGMSLGTAGTAVELVSYQQIDKIPKKNAEYVRVPSFPDL